MELYLVAVMLTWCYNDMMYQLELISFRVNDTAPRYRKTCCFLEEKRCEKVPDFMRKCLSQLPREIILPFGELEWKRISFFV